MILRQKRDNEPDINLTALIDVVFLLLIFFMVSTTFERESEISIELPEASGKVVQNDQKVIEVSIDSSGRYFVNKQSVTDATVTSLMDAIKTARGDEQKPRLIISADKMTPHQSVVSAMDAARRLGLVNLTFATRQASDK